MSDVPPLNGDFMPSCAEGQMRRFLLHTEQEMQDENNTKILCLGGPSGRAIKCVLLVGETGAGKSTFINGVLNYLNGITFDQKYRLCVKDQMADGHRNVTESQTDYITVYKINHKEGMRHGCDFIFIDSPGIGDTRGQEQQQKIMKALEAFLTSDLGIDELHCLGVVTNATNNRNSSHQQDMLGDIMTLLGHHVPLITNVIATHATDTNYVGLVMEQAGVQFKEVFEFDNGVLFADNQSKRAGLMAERWKIMLEQYNTFFSALLNAKPVSVKVLREKKYLDISVRTLRHLVEKLAELLRKLELDQKDLSDHTLEEEKNRGWRQTREVLKKTRISLDKNFHAHNCNECNQSCIICSPKNVTIESSNDVPVALVLNPITIIPATIASLFGAFNKEKVSGGCFFANDQVQGSSVCGVATCGHSLSQHLKEEEKITPIMESEEFIVDEMKERHEEAVTKMEDAKRKIDASLEKIQNEKNAIVQVVLKTLTHFKNVQKLSAKPIYTNTEELVDGILVEIQRGQKQNIVHVLQVLNIIKKAAKELEKCEAESVAQRGMEVMEIFENLPEGQR